MESAAAIWEDELVEHNSCQYRVVLGRMELFDCVDGNLMDIESGICTREHVHLGEPFLKAMLTISMACMVVKILVNRQGIKRAFICFFNH